jgi:hypothetical protein
MRKRPKSSYAEWGTVGTSLLNARTISSLKDSNAREISSLKDSITNLSEIADEQSRILGNSLEVQVVSAILLNEIQTSIEKIVGIADDIFSLLKRNEDREDNLGKLRIIILNLNKVLDNIENEFLEEYPEWGYRQLNEVRGIITNNNITAESFSRSWGDIEKVESLHEKLNRMDSKFLSRLNTER